MNRRKSSPSLLGLTLTAAAVILLGAVSVPAATIRLINADGRGEGLNDGTAASPVGGNAGSTLGELRLNAINRAAEIWASQLESPVDIEVEVRFDPLRCDAESAVLGQASPNSVHSDFVGAARPATFYPAALANSLAGIDLCPPGSCRNSVDISAQFSSSFGTTCAFSGGWYYGLDTDPPGRQADLVTVALHEIGHGLGFLSLVDTRTGSLFMGESDAYANFVADHRLGLTFDRMSNRQRADAIVSQDRLHFIGKSVVNSSDRLASGADENGHVLLYAPQTLQPGSSLSHFDRSASPNELMEPVLRFAVNNVGLAANVLRDIGWSVRRGGCDGDCDGDLRVRVPELVAAVRVALGEEPIGSCLPADAARDGRISIADLIRSVRSSLVGCGGAVVSAQVVARQHLVAADEVCTGDCNGDGTVSVSELIRGVNLALGAAEVMSCQAFDADGDERVRIGELIGGVSNALNGCPCPFDLLDERAGVERACVFAGRWNDQCGDSALPATFSVVGGLVGVAIVTGPNSPTLTFFAQTSTELEASLVGFTFGEDTVQLGGSVRLSEDGRRLTVTPDTDPEVLIDDCPVVRYSGSIARIVTTAEGSAVAAAIVDMTAAAERMQQ